MNSRRILPSLMVTASFAVESVSFAHGRPRTPVDTRGHRMSYDVDRCHLSSQTALPPRRGPDTQKETLTRGAPDQIEIGRASCRERGWVRVGAVGARSQCTRRR